MFTKFLVPVTGKKADDDIVRTACVLARRSKGKVYVVHVIQVSRVLPLDAEVQPETQSGESVLANAEKIADMMDSQVETEILQARETGPAIVDEAVERGVDMIIMGLEYKKPFGEFDMGDTVPYILRNAPCRVLLWRGPMEEAEE
ncbi:MAG TPA: universal stress protein [Dehalococcoidia bacterium]|nr:universal stress protein [Dehalococcoidia bacterium]